MSWTQTEAGPAPLNPYEAWDTLGLENVRDEETRFQPVYVQLKRDPGKETFADAASFLLDVLDEQAPTEKVYAPESTIRRLKCLQAGAEQIRLGKVFVYRLNKHAASTELNGRADILEAVLHVGPVIPGQVPPETTSPSDVNLPGLRVAEGVLQPPVVTAVIDDEIGFLNSRFQTTGGRTRIKRFWSMTPERFTQAQTGLVGFGTVLKEAEINAHLAFARHFGEAAAYAQFDAASADAALGEPLQLGRFRDPSYRRPRALTASHGTAVLDFAAGRDPGTDIPERPILAVELPQLATADTSGGWLDAYILQAAIEVMDWADNVATASDDNLAIASDDTERTITPKPLVINLSYGINAGPKDGSGFLARNLAELVEERNAYASTWIVLPTGNSRQARGRAELDPEPRAQQTLVWEIAPDDASPSFLEIFLEGSATLSIGCPSGAVQAVAVTPTTRGEWRFVPDTGDAAAMAIYAQPHGAGTRITCAVAPTRPGVAQNGAVAQSGAYPLTLVAADDRVTGSVEVQRDDTPTGYATGARQSVLTLGDGRGYEQDPETGAFTRPVPPLTTRGTISTYATAQHDNILVVAGAERLSTGAIQAARYSSAGTAALDPDLSILSEDGRRHAGRLSSGLYSGSSVSFGGTSMAAAQATRSLVQALDQNRNLTKAAFLSGENGLKVPVTTDQANLGAKVLGLPLDSRRVRG